MTGTAIESRTPSTAADVRRSNFLTINGMMQRMMHLAGIDNRDADTIRAVIACQRAGGLSHTPFQVANVTIGRKLCIRTRERDNLERTAQRRLSRLFDTSQPGAGREFITRIKGEYDPETQRHSMHTYIDNLTPAADQAYQSFREYQRSDAWRTLTAEERRAIFDRYAVEALETLPEADQGEETPAKMKKLLPLAEYQALRERQILESLEASADKIQDEYADPAEAIHFLRALAAKINRRIESRGKMNRRERERLTTPPPDTLQGDTDRAGGARGYTLGDTNDPHTPGPVEPDRGTFHQGGGDKMSPLPLDNPPENNNLQAANVSAAATWAEKYTDRGWYALAVYAPTPGGCACKDGHRCTRPGKHPIGGIATATGDFKQIERTLRRHPSAGLGLATGPQSDCIALDFDGPEGRELFKEFNRRGWIHPDGLVQETPGGGLHYLIRWIDGISSKVAALPGLDIRAAGSFIVTAPSGHHSGGVYAWANWPGVIPEAPDGLRDELLRVASISKPRAVEATPAELTGQPRTGPDYPDGTRNNALFRVAAGLRGRKGATADQIRAELTRRNNRLSAPLPERELDRIVMSACRYPAEVAV